MKVKKRFLYKDIELRIVTRHEPYMNSGETVEMTRVLAPNEGSLPLILKHKQTLKSIVEQSINFLNEMEKCGSNVRDELTRTSFLRKMTN